MRPRLVPAARAGGWSENRRRGPGRRRRGLAVHPTAQPRAASAPLACTSRLSPPPARHCRPLLPLRQRCLCGRPAGPPVAARSRSPPLSRSGRALPPCLAARCLVRHPLLRASRCHRRVPPLPGHAPSTLPPHLPGQPLHPPYTCAAGHPPPAPLTRLAGLQASPPRSGVTAALSPSRPRRLPLPLPQPQRRPPAQPLAPRQVA